MSNEADLRLRDRAAYIDPSKIGLISCNLPHLSEDMIKAVAAQAIMDYIVSTEQGLCIRNLYPDLDLIDEETYQKVKEHRFKYDEEWSKYREKEKAIIADREKGKYKSKEEFDKALRAIQPKWHDEPKIFREWLQPPSGAYKVGNKEEKIYTTKDPGRKIILIYGAKNLPPNNPLNSTSLIFYYRDIKRVGDFQLETLPDEKKKLEIVESHKLSNEKYEEVLAKLGEEHLAKLEKEPEHISLFKDPKLFKRTDNIEMRMRTKKDAVGKHDNIMLLGIVAEALGSYLV